MPEASRVIQGFLESQFRKHAFADVEEDIFNAGFVNSLFAMKLVVFLEKEFSLAVGPEDLDLANFRSIAAMTRFVERKRAAAGPGA
jgi:methoxymalonate biosynthesis acyl carrier protein